MKKIVFFTVLVGLALGFTGCESKEKKRERCLQELNTALFVTGEMKLPKECLEVLLEIENEDRAKNGLEPKDIETFKREAERGGFKF
jgi:hypothetical protein